MAPAISTVHRAGVTGGAVRRYWARTRRPCARRPAGAGSRSVGRRGPSLGRRPARPRRAPIRPPVARPGAARARPAQPASCPTSSRLRDLGALATSPQRPRRRAVPRAGPCTRRPCRRRRGAGASVCALLTPAQARAALGWPIGSRRNEPIGEFRSCGWYGARSGPHGPALVQVQVSGRRYTRRSSSRRAAARVGRRPGARRRDAACRSGDQTPARADRAARSTFFQVLVTGTGHDADRAVTLPAPSRRAAGDLSAVSRPRRARGVRQRPRATRPSATQAVQARARVGRRRARRRSSAAAVDRRRRRAQHVQQQPAHLPVGAGEALRPAGRAVVRRRAGRPPRAPVGDRAASRSAARGRCRPARRAPSARR